MHGAVELALKYLNYRWNAANKKGHGIHSPFIYDLVRNVLNDKKTFYPFLQIEALRKKLIANNTIIPVVDYGAGSVRGRDTERKVSDIARLALKSPRFGKLLYRLISHYNYTNVLELGTSLGITASYMGAAIHKGRLITLEGAPDIASLAKENFVELKLDNIELLVGPFVQTLPQALEKLGKIDLAFLDGHHRLIPTLNYFEEMLPNFHEHSILVVDDIHWSKEMEQAWEKIKAHKKVRGTADLFWMGLVFFRTEFREKSHFVLR